MENVAQTAKRLLVVDDDDTVVQTLATILIRHGYYVDTETDGNEALRKVTEGDYDLAIVDILIPERSGFQICERIRSRDRLRGRHTPIIVISARDTADFRLQARIRRVDEYIGKPFPMGRLRQAVERLLAGESAAAPAPG
jgi:DNA-binding response OmpR family regulator